MATLTFALDHVCSGGGHADVTVSLNGGAVRHFVYTVDDIRASLASMSADDQAAAALAILKLHFAGKTRAQIGTEFQSPVTVTI